MIVPGDPPDGELTGTARIGVRFGATVVANVVRAGLAFLGGIVVARALGVSNYGDLSFLVATFTAVSFILDMGTSEAFYTFVARRTRSFRFFAVYLVWTLGVQLLGSLLVLGLLLPDSAVQRLFAGQERTVVLLAFAATFTQTQIWGIGSMLGEARRKTVIVQAGLAAQALVHFALVLAGWQLQLLTVGRVLGLLAVEYLLLVFVLVPRFIPTSFTREGKPEPIRAILREFVVYCRPLAAYVWVGFAAVFADRWLLQHFGGSAQQGYFAVSQQFANVSLIAATSILNVYWKETAEALEQGRLERAEHLYQRTRRGLFFSAACLSCFLIPFSRQILEWTVGSQYADAWPAFTLMLLVPVQQGLGRVQGTFFYASGDTARYSRIGILIQLGNLPLTYLVLASSSSAIPGLSLGAVGLAAKTFAVQMVGVLVLGYVIARSRGWRTDHLYQVAMAALFIAGGYAAWGLGWSVVTLADIPLASESRLVVALVAYLAGTLLVLRRYPALAGLDRAQVDRLLGLGARLRRGTIVSP